MRRAASARQRCGPGTSVSRATQPIGMREFAFASKLGSELSLLQGQIHCGGNNDVNVLFVATLCDGTDSGQGLDGKLMPIL